MIAFRESQLTSSYATAPLVGMILAITLAVLPLSSHMAAWVLVAFFTTCILRLFLNRPGARLPSLPVKIILFAAGAAGVGMSYGTALGVDPGFSILGALVALKLIEANGSRDFHVLALLGFFLALCDLFFSQDLIRWLYVAAILLLILATLVRFHRGAGAPSYLRSAGLAAALLLQTLPITLLLFLFFPRVYGGFRFQFSQPLMNIGAMSETMSPGSIASIALNDTIVFRADFPDGHVPAMPTLYWRGAVMWEGWEGDGMNWGLGKVAMIPDRRPKQLAGPAIRQGISLQPHGQHWLFALDHPASEVKGARYLPGNVLQSVRAVNSRLRYEVVSRPEDRELILPADQRDAALHPPNHVSPQVKALVDGWKAGHTDPQDIIAAALRYFRHEKFVYTFKPGAYRSEGALDEFLFERRTGFCEHYAAAFATLMRIAGLPARVVIGYHGGEFNSLGKYIIVRQADSHAWCEVWIKDKGWMRVDPTDMIAPDRITSGLASFLEAQASRADPSAAERSAAATGWRQIQHELQLAWDSVNYQWDLHVLNYDEEAQHNFLFSLGLGWVSFWTLLLWVAIATAVLLALLGLWLHRPRGAVDKVSRGYERYCATLARAGLPREPWEGPQHFATRAAQQFPAQAPSIARVTDLYVALRYGPTPASPRPFLEALRHLPRFTAAGSGT